MTKKVKVEQLRARMAQKGIFTIVELAKRVGCRRETIYLILDAPARFPIASAKLEDELQ